MHALALKDKEEEHAGLLHTAGEIQVGHFKIVLLMTGQCISIYLSFMAFVDLCS